MTIDPIIRFHFEKPVGLRDRAKIKATIRSLFKKESTKLADLQFIFCSDKRLLEINRQFLNHDFYTDIITFPLSEPGDPVMAEIYISVDRVKENARNLGETQKSELLRVIFHGALHLCGYRDKSEKEVKKMRALEEKYLVFHGEH